MQKRTPERHEGVHACRIIGTAAHADLLPVKRDSVTVRVDSSPMSAPHSHSADMPYEDRRRKVDKGLDTRKMEPGERYRALSDLLDNYADLSEYADRKARFALVVMG